MVKKDSKVAVLLLLVPKTSRVVMADSRVVVPKVSPVVVPKVSPVVVRLDSLLAAVMMVVDSILLMLMISLSISLLHLVVEVAEVAVLVEWEVCPEEAWEVCLEEAVCQAVDIQDVNLVSPKSLPPSSVLFYFH
jgi:hypothetical protein